MKSICFKAKVFGYSLIAAILYSPFTPVLAGSECFEDPGLENKPEYKGSPMGNDGQKALSEQKMDENSDPVMEILMCYMQLAFEGPEGLIEGNCGCKQVVEDNCEFGFDSHGTPFAIGLNGVQGMHCAGFAIVYLGAEVL